MMADHEIQGWAALVKEYPEAAWATAIGGVVVFLAINFAWWLIELPGLVNAHSDRLLIAGFAGSAGLFLFDVVFGIWAFRRATRISAAMDKKGKNNDDEA